MIGYRCYFLGEDGKIRRAEEFTAANDTAAIDHARAIFAKGDFPGLELWQGGRVIYTDGVSSARP